LSSYYNVKDAPDAPINLKNSNERTGRNNIYMSWENGENNGGLPITKYIVNLYENEAATSTLET